MILSQLKMDVTVALEAYADERTGAFDRLFDLVYGDLRRIAQTQLKRRRSGLEATGLVHELYMKMASGKAVSIRDRGHFFAVAARAMRQILVDHARKVGADKRGAGHHHTGLESVDLTLEHSADEVIEVHRLLGRLGELDERLVRVVECRYFAGLTEDETAAALEVSSRTVQRAWLRARAWLKEEMRP